MTTPTLPRKPWLHAASAGVILGVDWLFFGAEFITLGGGVLFTSAAAFVITTIGVFWIQRSKNGDSLASAGVKALFAGIVAGIPTSIGGTVLGALVLALAGLRIPRPARSPCRPAPS